jgi:8-oxo-dGTP pyrophosphatase MutT (NUDIX family)
MGYVIIRFVTALKEEDDVKVATFVALIGVVVKQMEQNEHQILLLKRNAERRTSPNKWQTPSGFIKEGESAEEAVLREVKEETSLGGYYQEEWKCLQDCRRMGKMDYRPVPNFSQIR